MRRPRLLAGAAVVSMALGLAACGDAGPSDSPGESPDDGGGADEAEVDLQDPSTIEGWASNIRAEYEGTEITLAANAHPSVEAFQQIDQEFTDLTGIRVNWDVIEQTALKNKQLLDYDSNTQIYDILFVDPFAQAEFVDKGVIAPIGTYLSDDELVPAWFDYEDIVPAYSAVDEFDDEVYGIPVAGESRFLGYRTDLFEKYDKQPPESMEEFLELAEFFHEKEPGLYGVAMRAQRGIHFGSGLMSVMYGLTDGFVDQDSGEPTMDDPEMVEALQFYVDLLSFGPPDIASYTHEEALSAFATGKTAMWFDATAIAPGLLDPESSDISDSVDFIAPPDGPKGPAAAIAGWRMALSSNSENPEAAMALITFLASKEMSEAYVDAGGVPTRTSQFTNPSDEVEEFLFPTILESLDKAKQLADRGISYVPAVPNLGQIMEVVGYWGSLAQEGSISVEEAAEEAQKELLDL